MTNDNGRDKELDELLKSLKQSFPSELQMQKWKSLAQTNGRNEIRFSVSRSQWVLQLAAAVFVGVVIGVLATKKSSPSELQTKAVAQISFSDDATYEHSHANLD